MEIDEQSQEHLKTNKEQKKSCNTGYLGQEKRAYPKENLSKKYLAIYKT